MEAEDKRDIQGLWWNTPIVWVMGTFMVISRVVADVVTWIVISGGRGVEYNGISRALFERFGLVWGDLIMSISQAAVLMFLILLLGKGKSRKQLVGLLAIVAIIVGADAFNDVFYALGGRL